MNEQDTYEVDPPLKLTIQLAQKVSTAPYESADVSLFISGVTQYSTDEEIAALVEKGKVAYSFLAQRLQAMAVAARQNNGWVAEPTFEAEEEVPFSEPPRQVRQQNGPTAAAPTAIWKAPACPDCGGDVWDNRENKRNPKGPDFKCKSKTCGAAGWIDKQGGIKWVPGEL